MISGRLIDGIFEIGASNKRMYNSNYSPGTVRSAHVLCKLATFIATTSSPQTDKNSYSYRSKRITDNLLSLSLNDGG